MPNCVSYARMDQLWAMLENGMPLDVTDRGDLMAVIMDLSRCRKHIAKLREMPLPKRDECGCDFRKQTLCLDHAMKQGAR